MTDPEEFQPSGLPDDLSTVEADEADVQEQATLPTGLAAEPDADGPDADGPLSANTAQGSTGPEPDGTDA